MPWTNYHSHTHFCDGSDDPELYIEYAIKQKMIAFGYSSHAPILFDSEWTIPDNKLDDYLEQVKSIKKKYADRIETYLGLEIDFIPGCSGRHSHILENLELDYFIGSIHFVESFNDGTFWNIDHNKKLFEKGLNEIFKGSFRAASDRFYELTRQMIEQDAPDVVGHLDKIKMYNSNRQYFSEDESWYKNQVEETLKAIKRSGTIVEVNTRGYYKYNQLDLYPSQWIIEKLAKKDIPIMLNSDSHEPHEVNEGFSYAAEKLKKAGVKRLWALIGAEWQAYEYNSDGLIL